uniref:Phosphoribosylglycinamide formyltransferase, chloroplastic n=1 Tax=Kalanchoe fedtschenkoi TaxID=63787 RepID=A0A7N0UGU3_KALFE
MEAQSLFHGLQSKRATPPLNSILKGASNTSIGVASVRICVRNQWNYRGERLRRRAGFTAVSCGSRVELEKGESFNAKCESVVGKKRLAVFVSGGGSNFRSIYEATLDGSVNGDVVVLVTNKPACGGAEFARERGIPVIVFPQRKDEQGGMSASDLVDTLRRYNADYVLLAGYLKLIPAELIRAYPKSILNIHPSLLPAFGGKGFYGMKVHDAVIASGARFSGPTIHFVDENFDTGRILAQRVVPVLATDTAHDLAARVLLQEHKLYVEVTAALCEGRILWREDGVPLIQSKQNPKEYS